MRSRLLALGIIVLACASAHAVDQYECYNGSSQQGGQVVTVNGIQSAQKVQRSYPGATVTVYLHNTLTLATVWQDAAGTIPLANPYTSSTTGVAFFCAADGRYDVKYSGTGVGIATPFTISDIHLCFSCSGGGGTVGPGTVNQVAKFITTTNVGDSTGFDNGTNPVQWPNGLTVRGNAIYKSLTNASGGTTLNLLVEKDSSGNAITALVSSARAIGIADNGAGTSGVVDIAFGGFHNCVFDNQTSVNDYVVPSTSVAGQCSDAGASKPTDAQIIGTIVTVNTGAGTLATVDLFTGDTIAPGATGGSGTVSNCASTLSNAFYQFQGTVIVCDSLLTDDGAGNGTARSFGFTDATKAGFVYFVQGTTPGIGPVNSVTISAPTSVTAYQLVLPGTAATGCLQGTNVAGVVTLAFSGTCGGATFQTNGTNNSDQTFLNLVNGTGVTITNTSAGNVQISSSGGVTLQTNSVNNSSQTTLNLLNSATTFDGYQVTHTNTSGGNVQLGITTLNTQAADPSAPTVTPTGVTGATTDSYLIIGCQDPNCARTSATSGVGTTTTANATLTTSNYNLLTGYADTLYGYRFFKVCRTVAGGTPSSTGVIATGVGKAFKDTGGAGDGSNCASLYATNNTKLDDHCLSSSAPGVNAPPGTPCGVDAPPATPKAENDEMTPQYGAPGDSNDGVWAWNNQNSATSTWTGGMLSLTSPARGGTANRNCLDKALPGSTPWTFVTVMYLNPPPTSVDVFGGIELLESATGKSEMFGFDINGGTANQSILFTTWNNTFTAPTFVITGVTNSASNPTYFKVQNNGTNLIFSSSADGVVYTQVRSETITTFFTTAPDKVGLCLSNKTNAANYDFDYFRRTQ